MAMPCYDMAVVVQSAVAAEACRSTAVWTVTTQISNSSIEPTSALGIYVALQNGS